MTEPITWERIADPLDRRRAVWWRGTWAGCGPAYLSVALRDGVYVWAVRRRPGRDHIAAEGRAAKLTAARGRADRARAALAVTPRPEPEPEAPAAPGPQADIPASMGHMPMTNHERAKAANAALTTEQRSAAGKARAAQLHHPITLARRIAAKWPELSDEDRKAVRRELRAAGIIT